MSECRLCPRECGTDRASGEHGFCGEGENMIVSRASLHHWEEPPISGSRGSGTIFFGGCSLRCVFCQNKTISSGGGARRAVTEAELADIMLSLEEQGAHNINLVTPTHFADKIASCLEAVRPRFGIPIVYNSSGYERVETLRMLDGLIDVYMPDFKYASASLASDYSSAPDYPAVALAALVEMYRQVGACEIDGEGIMKKGLIVRHLVLPSCRKDSIAVLDTIASALPTDAIKLSLMSQYTPEFALDCEYKNLHRRLTSFEYRSVLHKAIELGFDGYFQTPDAASTSYTPDFESECSSVSFI